MNSQILFNTFVIINIVIACGVIFAVNRSLKRILCILAPLFWVFQLSCYFSEAGIYSLSGVAPTCAIAAIILSLCQCISLKNDEGSKRPRFNGIWLLLLALVSLIPDQVRHDSFMMTYLFAILFFLSRPLSLGFTLYSLAGMAHLITDKKADNRMLKTSKDAALIASILFLGGEIVGCYWGFMGWGTTWRWSGNFQFSAMLFVLFMVSLHIPATLFRTRFGRNLAFSLPLLGIALCLVLSKVTS